MNNTQRRTLETIFAKPEVGDLQWSRVESMMKAAGCRIVEGSGSRIRFATGEQVLTMHRPHAPRTARKYQIRELREFLTRIGVKP